jgi:phospholipid/cholesterol/gamma-HCH transport system substrate-binding protein
MTSIRRVTARVAGLGLVGTLLTGCGAVSLQGVPLPGGADLGGEPYEVTVQLRDALDLVPQSSVRVNNVAIGQVKSIDLDQKTWNANVLMELNSGVKLPANPVAQLKQTTLLGEKYIELGSPTDTPAQGTLADGAVIPADRTNRFPEVEEIFGALSMLLNGGGIGQVQNIAQELNKALDGHEGDTKALLTDLNTLVSTLDGEKLNVTRALDGVDQLSARLVEQRANLDSVLTDLEPGLAVLNEQRPQLVGMLKSLDKLSDTATHVVEKSHKDAVADLEALRPTLRELAQTGDTLPKSLEVLATPPFTDAAIKPSAGRAMNLDFQLNIDLVNLISILSTPPPSMFVSAPALPSPLSTLPIAPLADPLAKVLPKAPLADQVPSPPKVLPKAPAGLSVPGLGGNR